MRYLSMGALCLNVETQYACCQLTPQATSCPSYKKTMPFAVRPCSYCKTLVPQISVAAGVYNDIVRALSNGSRTMATSALKYAVSCSEQEAISGMEHLLSCAASWPTSVEDEKYYRQLLMLSLTSRSLNTSRISLAAKHPKSTMTHCEQ